MRTDDRGDRRILHLPADGPKVSTSDDASDLIGNAWSEQANVVAVPVERLDPTFFDLRSRVAGEVAQKLVNYRIQLVVVGDVSAHEEASDAFRDWVRESNAGSHVWFVPDEAALEDRLSRS